MPRSEARIFTSIWRDPAYVCMPADAQWLYEFLLSQDDLSYCGVIALRPGKWCKKAADMTVDRIGDALKWLEGRAYPSPYPSADSAPTPLVVTDEETQELFVRSLMRRDGIWKQPNVFKLAIEAAGQVDSLRILGAMLAEVRRFPLEETGSDQVKTLVADFITALEKGSPYPTPYPPPDPADYPPDDPSDDGTANHHARAQGLGGSVADPGSFPEPLIPGPQVPDLLGGVQGGMPRKNATRLPEGWQPSAELLAWAAEKAPHVDPERETERFTDHWRGKPGRDGRKLDWDATWRNWMRNAEDRQGPRDRPVNRRQAADDAMFEEAAQRIAARRETT